MRCSLRKVLEIETNSFALNKPCTQWLYHGIGATSFS